MHGQNHIKFKTCGFSKVVGTFHPFIGHEGPEGE